MKKAVRTFAIAMALSLTLFARSPGLHATQKTSKKAEPRSDIHGALNSLEKVKTYLTLANHDFGGHRDDAIKAVEGAIKQLQLAESFDKK